LRFLAEAGFGPPLFLEARRARPFSTRAARKSPLQS
jgi:hypothetical protein